VSKDEVRLLGNYRYENGGCGCVVFGRMTNNVELRTWFSELWAQSGFRHVVLFGHPSPPVFVCVACFTRYADSQSVIT
jgi:hypothetical protein